MNFKFELGDVVTEVVDRNTGVVVSQQQRKTINSNSHFIGWVKSIFGLCDSLEILYKVKFNGENGTDIYRFFPECALEPSSNP